MIRAWGFTYRSNIVWDKVKAMGLGAWVRQRHELLLIGTRGSFPHPHADPVHAAHAAKAALSAATTG